MIIQPTRAFNIQYSNMRGANPDRLGAGRIAQEREGKEWEGCEATRKPSFSRCSLLLLHSSAAVDMSISVPRYCSVYEKIDVLRTAEENTNRGLGVGPPPSLPVLRCAGLVPNKGEGGARCRATASVLNIYCVVMYRQ